MHYIILGASALILSLPAFAPYTIDVKTSEINQQVVEAPLPVKDELDVRLEALARCESSGRADIKILDSNKKYSYGILQFQEETFKGFTKAYNLLPQVEDAEIMNFVYDADYQFKLAKTMLEKDPSAWTHWRNCSKKTGLDKYLNERAKP